MLISKLHADWGEAIGNYDEFRFFTGLRPSEQIALLVTDYDARRGVLSVTKARVLRRDKDRTKAQEDRDVELCPLALEREHQGTQHSTAWALPCAAFLRDLAAHAREKTTVGRETART
jgi:integrase